MHAIVVTKLIDGQPDLPPMDAETGLQLHHTKLGVTKGGWSMLLSIPRTPPNCAVWVECDQATLDFMMTDIDRFPAIEVCVMAKLETDKEKKDHLEQWLKNRGHNPDKAKGNTILEMIANTFDIDIEFLNKVKAGNDATEEI